MSNPVLLKGRVYANPRNNFDTPIIVKYVSLREFFARMQNIFHACNWINGTWFSIFPFELNL